MKSRLSAVVVAIGMLIGCTPTTEMASGRAQTADAPGMPAGREREFPTSMRASIGATSPDRGELLAYDRTRQAKRFDAVTFHPVAVNEEHALNAIASGQLTATSPDGEVVQLKYMTHFQHPGHR